MTLTADTSCLFRIKNYFPQNICVCLSKLDKNTLDKISEIRLRKNGITTVTIDGMNLYLSLSGITTDAASSLKTSEDDIEDFIYKFCKGSVYTHENTLSEFYIVNDGIRVGISGKAVYSNTNRLTPSDIYSLNIRIPHHIRNCSQEVAQHISDNGFFDSKGILIASPPGVGKTTFLRDLAIKLSDGSISPVRRVCVIDERNEIFMNRVFDNCCTDLISGVEKVKAIEIAARVLSPEVIICDEISGPDEAEKITRQKNGGIIFIASVHSETYAETMRKEYIRSMFEKCVFSHLCLLKRCGGKIETELIRYEE